MPFKFSFHEVLPIVGGGLANMTSADARLLQKTFLTLGGRLQQKGAPDVIKQ